MRPSLAPLVEALPAGVLHASLPTPFPVGPVNCYLLADPPVTIVDPGMLWQESLEPLQRLIAEVGSAPGVIDQVVVTHAHPDHFGAAAWIAERADCPILCGRDERPKLLLEHDRLFTYGSLLADLGIPADLVATLPGLYRDIQAGFVQTPTAEMVVAVDDGQMLKAGGTELEVMISPGHATGHVSLFDHQTSVLFSGDHLLPRITPNPVLDPDPDAIDGRRHSLVEYLSTLDRFTALNPAVVLPGHGEPFTDVPALVSAMRRHHDERAVRIVEVVAAIGSPTPYEISTSMFKGLTGFGTMLGVSEIVGHLDLLIETGAVDVVSRQPLRVAVSR